MAAALPLGQHVFGPRRTGCDAAPRFLPSCKQLKRGTPCRASASSGAQWSSPEEQWAYGGQGLIPGRAPPKQQAVRDDLLWRARSLFIEALHYSVLVPVVLVFVTLLHRSQALAFSAQTVCLVLAPAVHAMAVAVANLVHEYEGWQLAPARMPASWGKPGEPHPSRFNNLWLRQVLVRFLFLYFLVGYVLFSAGVLGWHTQATAGLLALQAALLAAAALVRPALHLSARLLLPESTWKDVDPAVLPLPWLVLPAFAVIAPVFAYAVAVWIGVAPTLSAPGGWEGLLTAAGTYSAGSVVILGTIALALRAGPSFYPVFRAAAFVMPPLTIWLVTNFWAQHKQLLFCLPLVLLNTGPLLELLVAESLLDEWLHIGSFKWVNAGYFCLFWMLRGA